MAHRRPRVSALATLVALSVLSGCGGGDGGGGPIDPEFDLAVGVEGTVLDLEGQPVFGVTVQITAYVWTVTAGCTAELVGPPQTTPVNEEGDFNKTLGFEGSLEDEVEACLTVEALPPLGYFGDTRSNIRAEIRPRDQGVQVIDVALTLEPAT